MLAVSPSGRHGLLERAAWTDTDGAVATRRLLWFMVGRLVVATLLLGMTLWQGLQGREGEMTFTTLALSSLIAATYAASLVFAIILPLGGTVRQHGLIHLAFDLILTTAIVYLTGGLSSAFVSVYGVHVLMAALILTPSATVVTALISVGLYVVVGVGIAAHWWPHPPDQSFDVYMWQGNVSLAVVVRSAVALISVSVLAATLANRIRVAGGALALVEEQAEKLVHLNDRIVRSISSGIITTDGDGRIETFNPAAARILMATDDELVGKPLSDFLGQEIDGDPIRRRELGHRMNGDAFSVGYSRTELLSSDAEAQGQLVTFQDLTEIEALRNKANAAERLATLGRLAAGLAHEIRNPLSSISGSVELVSAAPELADEDRKLLSMVLQETERLGDLVSSMLEIAQPREPARTRLDLREILEEVARLAERGLGAASGVNIRVADDSPSVFVFADGGQIRQVVWNLVKNAVQASTEGQVVVLCCEEEGGSGWLEVRDSGVGIDQQSKERLFDAFYSGRAQGVGIGLSLVQQIVRAHDGEVSVDSEVHAGTTFRVTFPIHRTSSSPPPGGR